MALHEKHTEICAVQLSPADCGWTHWLANQIYWYGMDLGLRKLQNPVQSGKPSMKSHCAFHRTCSIQTPLLLALSPTVLARSAEWSKPHIHMTGYLFLDHR